MDTYLQKSQNLLLEFAPSVITPLLILLVGLFLIRLVMKSTKKVMIKKEVDVTLQKFSLNFISWILKILLFVTVISKLGITTTSFAAVIAAASLAIGLALQGSLGNFAGGVLIMVFKPFKIGDLIEAQGEMGVVKEIEIFTTKLTGLSNKEIIIPNGAISNGNIVNYTKEGTKRVDLIIGVSYSSDIKKTKEVLMKVLKSHQIVLETPTPIVAVLALADSSVNFAVRPWYNSEDY